VVNGEPWQPLILGLGGTTRTGSTSEGALRQALHAAAELSARVEILTAADLELPTYAPERGVIDPRAEAMLKIVSACDGLIVSTPGFHGGPSGLIKNAIDYIEELRDDPRPYLDGRAVGCIVTASGWQATATTLVAIRSTVHALRGWPTPLGVTINSSRPDPTAPDPVAGAVPQLTLVAEQVVAFARWRHAASEAPAVAGVGAEDPR
jgi:FMN reductase